MTREEQIIQAARVSGNDTAPEFVGTFLMGAEWADEHPSDETIMRILNAIGYEEKSWIEVVRKHLGTR